jgi:DNA-binding SARP family transcriptional activator/tetratricopeptide (TPR) repeat protein
MDFRILGPLEVWDRGRLLELRRPKHRALLAALLLRAGRAVSVDQLVDDLWGERPPPTAKGSLQNTVSALRKLLGGAVLRTQSPGYLLDVEREAVDLFRFERLLEEARDATSAEERIEKLRAALALWRGPPLADLAFEPFVLLEAPHLEELRISAREELIEARLALGREVELIPELESLVAEHPFNERLRGQLMLALYRAGRQAEALEIYREGRGLLVEQLGLEPSTPLRELEQAILRHDPRLTPTRTVLPDLLPMRKTATILLADLMHSGQLDSEALARLLPRYSAAAHHALERHGGAVEMLSGVGAMAVFGVPRAHEDDGLRALRAAVELRNEFHALGGQVELRIAISTGEVFVGGANSTGLVTGAVIDIAKRLGEAAQAGEILVGAGTVRLVRGAVTLEPLAPRLGEGRPLGAWRLLSLLEGAPAIPRRFEAPLVGRRQELSQVQKAFEVTRADFHCRLLVLAGEPGIGKTRLMHEFVEGIPPEATALIGRCTSYGQGATWLPLNEILREAGADTLESLSALLPAGPDGELATRRIAAVVGLADEPAPLEETTWAFRRLFEALAARGPLVLIFEDIHWAEPTLLDLIEHLSEQGSGSILVLCLTRPELLDTRTAWADRALMVAPLLEADVGSLVDSLGADLDPDARTRIVEIAEGNPLFAEQLALRAQEEGGGSLELVPPSIEALLASRIDLLSAEERALLQRAAAIGRRFSRAAVIELSALEPAATNGQLRSLIEKGFLRGAASEDMLRFHHVLVCNVAYAGLPRAERAELHERIAGLLDRKESPDEVVGYHLEQAYRNRAELAPPDAHALELGRRGAERLAAAADGAIAREDTRAAAALLDRATQLLPREELLRLRLLTRLGKALIWRGDVGRAAPVLEEAIEGARAVGDPRTEWSARLERSEASRLTAHQPWFAQARETEQAIRACEVLGHGEGLVNAWRLLGLLRGDLGQHQRAMEAVERALAYARRLNDEAAEREVLGTLGLMAVYGPTPVEEAVALVESQLKLAKARGYPVWETQCEELLAVLDAMRGRITRARATLERARMRREDLGGMGTNYFRAEAMVERLAGDAVAAERAYRAAQREFEARGQVRFAAVIAAELALVVLDQGRLDEAFELTQRSEQWAWGDPERQSCWRRARARVLAQSGRFDEAEFLAGEAVRLLAATDDLLNHGDALVDLAGVRRLAGRVDCAIGALEHALPLYERKGNIVAAERARDLLDEIRTSLSPTL